MIVVCDVSREGTVGPVRRWKQEVDEWAIGAGYADPALVRSDDIEGKKRCMPVVLFANKSDLLLDASQAFRTGATLER